MISEYAIFICTFSVETQCIASLQNDIVYFPPVNLYPNQWANARLTAIATMPTTP